MLTISTYYNFIHSQHIITPLLFITITNNITHIIFQNDKYYLRNENFTF